MSEPKPLLQKAIDRHYDGSISAAARRLKIDASYLAKIIRGDRQPTLEVATAISQLVGISLHAVLGAAPPAETRAERLARKRKSDKRFLKALGAAQKTPEHSKKMRAAGARGNAAQQKARQ